MSCCRLRTTENQTLLPLKNGQTQVSIGDRIEIQVRLHGSIFWLLATRLFNTSMTGPQAMRQPLILGNAVTLMVVFLALGSPAADTIQEPTKSQKRTITVAGILFEPVRTGDYKAANFRQAEELIREAAGSGGRSSFALMNSFWVVTVEMQTR